MKIPVARLKPHATCIVLGFAFVTLSAAVVAADETERVTRTVKLDPGGTLRLKNFSGRVTITGADQSEVTVDAVRTAPRERLNRVTLDIHTDGSMLVIDANHRENRSLWEHDNVVRTEFDIKVPRRTNLDVNVFSSPVEVRGVEGNHNVHAFSADLRLEDVAGAVRAHSFSGNVTIRETAWQPDQSIDVDTFSGSVDVHVPDSAHGRVSFNSFSGHLDSAIPLTFHSSSRRKLEATLGSDPAGGSLNVKTFSGNVRIDR